MRLILNLKAPRMLHIAENSEDKVYGRRGEGWPENSSRPRRHPISSRPHSSLRMSPRRFVCRMACARGRRSFSPHRWPILHTSAIDVCFRRTNTCRGHWRQLLVSTVKIWRKLPANVLWPSGHLDDESITLAVGRCRSEFVMRSANSTNPPCAKWNYQLTKSLEESQTGNTVQSIYCVPWRENSVWSFCPFSIT